MKPINTLVMASRGADAERIVKLSRSLFASVDVHYGNWGEPFPEECQAWRGDLIVSYCSRWIIPDRVLRVSKVAVNFHPAPPAYPGVGGINWALYDGLSEFGVTCHHMTPQVDSGPIIEVRRFPILPSDDVASLYDRTHAHLEALAHDILGRYATQADLPMSSESWSGRRRSRVHLNNLSVISCDMSESEIARRIRATNYKEWKPITRIGKFVFELKT